MLFKLMATSTAARELASPPTRPPLSSDMSLQRAATSSLPADVLREIFAYLMPGKNDPANPLVPLTTICRAWREILLNSPLLWRNIVISSINTGWRYRTELEETKLAAKTCYHLAAAAKVRMSVHFVMNGSVGRGVDVLEMLLAELPRWTDAVVGIDAQVKTWYSLTTRVVDLKALPALRCLTLISPPAEFPPAFWSCLPALTELSLAHCFKNFPCGALAVAKQLEEFTAYLESEDVPPLALLAALTPKARATITRVHSRGYMDRSLPAQHLTDDLDAISPSILVWELRFGNFSGEDFMDRLFHPYRPPKFTQLRRISIVVSDTRNSPLALQELRTSIPRCECMLEYLYIRFPRYETREALLLAELGLLLRLPAMKQLSELHIHVSATPGHVNGTDIFLNSFFPPLIAPGLRMLALRGFERIRGQRIDALARARPSIEQLCVDSSIVLEQPAPVDTGLKLRLVDPSGWDHFQVEIPSKILLWEV
ncbi:hypothetical protein MKEN_00622100 [Mycena kentingensis (nom. inval.)]|nr:hypothetical protein MKEN_00622100 [Mycena kentingensis (nom. inval.)]